MGYPNTIAAGPSHGLFLHKGAVFSWGSGTYGLHGHDHTNHCHTPKKIEGLTEPVVYVAAGECYSIILTESGQAYSWGCGEDGGLGHGNKNHCFTPKKIEGVREKIIQAAVGNDHSLALTASGRVLSWGHGALHQLGHGDDKDRLIPTKIEAFVGKIKQVAAARYHSLVLSTSGEVCGWGYGNYGCLGPQYVGLTCNPTIIEVTKEPVVQVAAGKHLSLALTESGKVFSWGRGVYGCLGHGDTESSCTPTIIQGISEEIVQIAASDGYALALGKSGQIWTWGLGKGGLGNLQPGAGRNPRPIPVLIKGLKDIKEIAAGSPFILAKDGLGNIYSWGNGITAFLGHGNNQCVSTPKKLDFFCSTQAQLEQLTQAAFHGKDEASTALEKFILGQKKTELATLNFNQMIKNERQEETFTPLWVICYIADRRPKAILHLLKHPKSIKLNFNTPAKIANHEGQTPLLWILYAAYCGQESVLLKLVEKIKPQKLDTAALTPHRLSALKKDPAPSQQHEESPVDDFSGHNPEVKISKTLQRRLALELSLLQQFAPEGNGFRVSSSGYSFHVHPAITPPTGNLLGFENPTIT